MCRSFRNTYITNTSHKSGALPLLPHHKSQNIFRKKIFHHFSYLRSESFYPPPALLGVFFESKTRLQHGGEG